jgi:hypothetical protein
MQTEDRLQISCARFLNLQYPKALWFHTPNGGSRNKIEGAKLKAMGTKKGVSDILIIERNKSFVGLAIELKILPNKPTLEQIEFLYQLKLRGWDTAVIYSIDAFIEKVIKYFENI